MMDVTVKVPEDRIAEFYAMHAAWLSSTEAQSSALSDIFESRRVTIASGAEDVDDRLPWTDTDALLAAKLWEKFSNAARALFSTLIDEPNRRFTGEELAEMLSIPNGHSGVAGVLAWPGKWCKQTNRKLLWEWGYPVPGEPVVYWMTPELAALFRDVRDSNAG
jgi:hypothetical protein